MARMHALTHSQGCTPSRTFQIHVGSPPRWAQTQSVCFFLKMENHESLGGGRARGAGRWGQGACWVTWEQLQPLWTMGPSCSRHLPGLLEGQAEGVVVRLGLLIKKPVTPRGPWTRWEKIKI